MHCHKFVGYNHQSTIILSMIYRLIKSAYLRASSMTFCRICSFSHVVYSSTAHTVCQLKNRYHGWICLLWIAQTHKGKSMFIWYRLLSPTTRCHCCIMTYISERYRDISLPPTFFIFMHPPLCCWLKKSYVNKHMFVLLFSWKATHVIISIYDGLSYV